MLYTIEYLDSSSNIKIRNNMENFILKIINKPHTKKTYAKYIESVIEINVKYMNTFSKLRAYLRYTKCQIPQRNLKSTLNTISPSTYHSGILLYPKQFALSSSVGYSEYIHSPLPSRNRNLPYPLIK